MNIFKLKIKTKFINEYPSRSKGHVKKDLILIRLMFFGIPIKTIKRFKVQYDGSIVEIDNRYHKK